MPDATSQNTISSRVTVAAPRAGEQLTVQSEAGGELEFAFAPGEALFSRSDNDLVVELDNGGTVNLADFFKVGDKPLPSLVLDDGSVVAASDFLAAFDLDMTTAAGPAAATSGGTSYEAVAGDLMDGVDTLDAQSGTQAPTGPRPDADEGFMAAGLNARVTPEDSPSPYDRTDETGDTGDTGGKDDTGNTGGTGGTGGTGDPVTDGGDTLGDGGDPTNPGGEPGDDGDPTNPGGEPGDGGDSTNPGGDPGDGGDPTNPGGDPGDGGDPTNPGGEPGDGGDPTNPGGEPGDGGDPTNPGGNPGDGGDPTNPGGEPGDGGDPTNPGGNPGDGGDPTNPGGDPGDGGEPTNPGGDPGDGGDPTNPGGEPGDGGDPTNPGGDPGDGGDPTNPGGEPGDGGDPTKPGGNPGDGGDPTNPGGEPGDGGDPTNPGGNPGDGGDPTNPGGEPGDGGDPTNPGGDPGDGGDPTNPGGDPGDGGDPTKPGGGPKDPVVADTSTRAIMFVGGKNSIDSDSGRDTLKFRLLAPDDDGEWTPVSDLTGLQFSIVQDGDTPMFDLDSLSFSENGLASLALTEAGIASLGYWGQQTKVNFTITVGNATYVMEAIVQVGGNEYVPETESLWGEWHSGVGTGSAPTRYGSSGNDEFSYRGASSNIAFFMGEGADALHIEGDASQVQINMSGVDSGHWDKSALRDSFGGIDADNGDTVSITGKLGGSSNVFMSDGDDFLSISGNLEGAATVYTGAGDDLVIIGGNILGSGSLFTGDGNDTVHIGGDISAGGGFVQTGAGDDLVYLNGEISSSAYVDLGSGNDTLVLESGFSFSQKGGGSPNFLRGGEGMDELNVDGWKDDIRLSDFMTAQGNRISGFEVINLGGVEGESGKSNTLIVDQGLAKLGLSTVLDMDAFGSTNDNLESLLSHLTSNESDVLRITGDADVDKVRVEGGWTPIEGAESVIYDSVTYTVFQNEDSAQYLLVQSNLL